jgi:hypothetical protein
MQTVLNDARAAAACKHTSRLSAAGCCRYAMDTPKEAVWSSAEVSGVVARHDAAKQHANSDYEQAGNLFRVVMTEAERTRLVSNIVGHLKNARRDIQGACWRDCSVHVHAQALAWHIAPVEPRVCTLGLRRASAGALFQSRPGVWSTDQSWPGETLGTRCPPARSPVVTVHA